MKFSGVACIEVTWLVLVNFFLGGGLVPMPSPHWVGLGLDPVLFPGVYLFHGHWYYLVVSYHFGKHWMRKQKARSDF